MNVSIEKELAVKKKQSEEALYAETALSDVKLLLTGDAIEDLEISRGLGTQHSLVYGETVNAQVLELEKMNTEYNGKVFKIEDIKALAIKYNLRFLSSTLFTGKMDVEVISKIKEFVKEANMPKLDKWQLSSKFFILAPEKCFHLTNQEIIRQKDLDPAIFYKIDEENYRLVHKWGADFTVFRLISGYMWKSHDNFFTGIAVITFPIVLFLMTWICSTEFKMERPVLFYFVTTLATIIITFFTTSWQRDEGKAEKRMFSPWKWNSKDKIRYA